MRYLTLSEVLGLHRLVVEQTGGATSIRDLGALESAVAQPRMTFDGRDLYSTVEAKAATLCFSIITNHPFTDGNKRTGHAAMETFLLLNGFEIEVGAEEAESIILQVAAGESSRADLLGWLTEHLKPA